LNCPKCGGIMVLLSLKKPNAEYFEFTPTFVCSRCGFKKEVSRPLSKQHIEKKGRY
jgi:DNA-directed RNA polymerase subunit M/transcription elongation factor TFIIS